MQVDATALTLVDTSAWIHFLRPDGDRRVAERVLAALHDGRASWCPMVRLELWNGAGGEQEKRVLRDFEQTLPELPIDSAVWNRAMATARSCRKAGITVPNTDLLISACATEHGAGLEHSDADFDRIFKVLESGEGPRG